MRRTKIVCTIGPASASREMLDRMVAAGMDVARLNFSHGTHEEHAEVIRAIREGEATWGHPITIVQDLQGPKVRLGRFVGGQALLSTASPLRSAPRTSWAPTPGPPCHTPSSCPCSSPAIRSGWTTG